LKKRTQRSGLNIVETRAWEEMGVLQELEETADYLLLDVPCSGTGVIKREPDTKWKLAKEHLDRLEEVQADILHRYPSMLKPGGTLVYATCSILPMENSNQVQLFLKNHPEFKLEQERTVDPAENNDGFYMAKLIKNT
jgi:16S rRNA (cytosine967-C5)-methyltransferase